MSTRGITYVHDGDRDSQVITAIYTHSDSYFDGHGKDLQAFLKGFKIVNGIGTGMSSKYANGMGCLAAQIVKHFKDGIGGTYLYPTDCESEEFNYHVFLKNDKLCLVGYDYNGKAKNFKL